MKKRILLFLSLVLSLLVLLHLASALIEPLGEFVVNTHVEDYQQHPSIAMDANGNFVITWWSYDPNYQGVYAQLYNSDGTPNGGEFQVHTSSPGGRQSAAMDPAGNFVIAWHYSLSSANPGDIFVQRFDSNGNKVGNEFRANTYTTNRQMFPSVAMDSSGNFVVAWQSLGQDGSDYGVYARRYDSSGTPLDANEFKVNTYTSNKQEYPSVAMDSAGNFVVAWQSLGQDGSDYGVYARRYNNAGTPLDANEFRVNTYTADRQEVPWQPSVAMDSVGNFVVAWQSLGQDGSDYGVYARRYDSSGTPLDTNEFKVSTYTADKQWLQSVAMDANSNFIITWTSNYQDGDGYGVYAKRYDSSGNELPPPSGVPGTGVGNEFQVNTYTNSGQRHSSAAILSPDFFVITWTGDELDGDRGGIIAQRYGVPVDTDGDGVSDHRDNCPYDYNPGQEDVDGDGKGDVCDPCVPGESCVDDIQCAGGTCELTTTIFEYDFEDGLDPDWGVYGSINVIPDPTGERGGSVAESLNGFLQRVMSPPAGKGAEFSAWIHDPGPLGDETIALYLASSSAGSYTYIAGYGGSPTYLIVTPTNFITTSVTRSTGWHEFEIVITVTDLEYYIDGSLAHSEPNELIVEGLQLYGFGSSPVYFDDVFIKTISGECVCCTDGDGDGYAVEGGGCGLIDCDDSDYTQYPGTTIVTDENLPWDSIGECRVEVSGCDGWTGDYFVIQEKVTPEEEVCDGLDNDCNGDIDDIDEDADGVNDCYDDLCLGSEEDMIDLNPNQYAQNLDFGAFEIGPYDLQSLVYTMEETYGCTCKQIAMELTVGKGHFKKGCSPSLMEEWTSISAQPDRAYNKGKK